MLNTIKISAQVRTQLRRWAEAGYPCETCGVLVGCHEGSQVYVVRAVFVRNVNTERTHDRYELDAEGLLAADNAACADGLEIIGIWHSHPDHPAYPSETDRIWAWSGWSYVIVSVHQGRATGLRSWRLTGEIFEEEVVELC